MNTQKPVTSYGNVKDQLTIHSIFKTIQGEGVLVGTPSVFLRLHGCNLQCPMCDTDYTNGSQMMFVKDIVEKIDTVSGGVVKTVVITGGEPLNQEIGSLVDNLYKKGYQIQLETNGTLFREGVDYAKMTVVCSPKTGRVHKKLQPFIHSYKYVGGVEVSQTEDGLPDVVLGLKTRKKVFRPEEGSVIYLQPADYGDEKLNKDCTEKVVKSCLDNNYTLCLQTHKILGVD